MLVYKKMRILRKISFMLSRKKSRFWTRSSDLRAMRPQKESRDSVYYSGHWLLGDYQRISLLALMQYGYEISLLREIKKKSYTHYLILILQAQKVESWIKIVTWPKLKKKIFGYPRHLVIKKPVSLSFSLLYFILIPEIDYRQIWPQRHK